MSDQNTILWDILTDETKIFILSAAAECCSRSNLIFAFFIAYNDVNSGMSESTTSTFIFISFPPRFAGNCYEPKDANFSPSPNL